MSVQVQERPVGAGPALPDTVATSRPAQEAPPLPATPAVQTVGTWERGWLWVALVLLFSAVVFGAMYVLTMLAGGPGYPY
jgi:hypothetical protein